MAFPTVSDTTTDTVTTNSTDWTLIYPGNIAAGDLLILFISSDGNPTSALPAGWTLNRYVGASNAVTLFIGLAISMYTALFLGRLLFDIAEKRRWLTKLSMMKLVPETNLDFLKYRFLCTACSLAVIVGGLALFFYRGDKNYDIDFTGGTMVSFQTTESQ